MSTVQVEDVVYHAPDGIELLARLYRPAGPGPFPAVVGVHGGRWCAESRLTNAVLDQALAEAGIFVMALDFRMPPAARYPAPVADINLAIRWLKLHAAQFGVAPDRIGGLGTSSGGHQILLNALRPTDPRYASAPLPGGEDIDASLAFVAAGWAVSDPVARYAYAKSKDMALHVQSHDAYWPDLAAMEEGSPQHIVERGDATHLPPILLVQGTADIILTPDMADRFAATYPGEISLKRYEGAPHTFVTKEPGSENALAAIEAIKAFIKGI
jgi:acetyl esterase/lipase